MALSLFCLGWGHVHQRQHARHRDQSPLARSMLCGLAGQIWCPGVRVSCPALTGLSTWPACHVKQPCPAPWWKIGAVRRLTLFSQTCFPECHSLLQLDQDETRSTRVLRLSLIEFACMPCRSASYREFDKTLIMPCNKLVELPSHRTRTSLRVVAGHAHSQQLPRRA